MAGVRCAEVEVDGRIPYGAALPPRCQPQCDACELHPGYMNNFREACRLKPRACDSAVCPPPQPRVPKRLRRLNFSGYHVRSFKVSSAFASLAELSLANVSAARVLSLEGYPGIFQTPPRHARALGSLVTAPGRAAMPSRSSPRRAHVRAPSAMASRVPRARVRRRQRRLRFVVGLRDPLDLGFSLW